MFFQEFLPAPALQPYIHMYAVLRGEMSPENPIETDLFIPSICKGLIIFMPDQHELFVPTMMGERSLPDAYLLGQPTLAHECWYEHTFEMFAVIFKPGMLQQFYPIPLSEYLDRQVVVAEMEDQKLLDFCRRIQDTRPIPKRLELADAFFLAKMASLTLEEKLSTFLVRQIFAHPQANLNALTEGIPLTQRHIRRVFQREMGISPKHYQKMVRFTLALKYLSGPTQPDLLEIAVKNGFYDLSHFGKVFKDIMGISPRTFLDEQFAITESIHYREEVYNGKIIRA